MNTELNIFNATLKRKSVPISVNNIDVEVKGYFKEIEDKQSVDTKWLFCPINTFKQGDIIETLGQKWIAIQKDVRYKNYDKALVRVCDKTIKFIDENNIITTYDSFIDAGVMDINEGKVTVADGEIYCTLKNDANSNKLKLDNRFIKFGGAWKIVGLDKTMDGLIKLHCKQDLINTSTDDMTNEVANAFSNVYTIKIQEGNLVMNVGDVSQLHAVTTLNENAVIKPITWTSLDENIATIDNQGNLKCTNVGNVTVAATLADNYSIKDSINIQVDLIAPVSYTVTLDGTDKIKCMTSTIADGVNYNAKLLKNGTEIACKFDFSIDYNGYDTKIATLKVIDDNNVKIYVNNKGLYTNSKKPLKLKAVNHGDNTQFVVKDIQVVSIMG